MGLSPLHFVFLREVERSDQPSVDNNTTKTLTSTCKDYTLDVHKSPGLSQLTVCVALKMIRSSDIVFGVIVGRSRYVITRRGTPILYKNEQEAVPLLFCVVQALFAISV
jgi:hypothetical protein